MYFTDRGLDELEDARGDEQVVVAWLIDRMREFIDLNPEDEVPIDRFAAYLARVDPDDDGMSEEDELSGDELSGNDE